MANPILARAHQIDIKRWNGSAWEIVCGITSQDFKLSRPPRETKVRDCAVDFAPPTMYRTPGSIVDATFSGNGKLDVDYRQEFKALWESQNSTPFRVVIDGFATFEAKFVITEFGVTSDAIDEAGYIDVAISLALDGAVTWTNV